MIDYKQILDDNNADVIIITDPYNLRYYTGFRGGEGIAVITECDRALLVDSRYTEAAKVETKEKGEGFRVIEYSNTLSKYQVISEVVDSDNKSEDVIAFEDGSMYVATLNDLKAGVEEYGLSNAIWKPLGSALDTRRQIKDENELILLKKAESIGDKAFAHILNVLRPGMTELEVAAEIEYSLKMNGAEGLSFDTIAASGINSSMPHAIPSEKKLEVGDFLTMDFGCVYKGYCSDMTRTVVIGKASDEQKKIYDIVRKAQEEALAFIKAQIKCMDVDKVARDVIAAEGYGEYFGHGLGHSVGLFIHESPALNSRDETILCSGMIETIEPGIYIPGFGGVRIEDMGVVTEDGFDNFTSSQKDLIEIY